MHGGNLASLWPKGCQSIEEIPYDLARAISHAAQVIRWQENLPLAEMPPEHIWPLDDDLKLHFDEVKSRRTSGTTKPGDEDENLVSNEMLR